MAADELRLQYVTRTPRSGGAGPHPALVLLHGRGANELDLLGLIDDLDPRFYVVSARAPLTLGPGYAWFHLQAIGHPDVDTFETSLAAIGRMLTELPDALPIDRTRIYTLGFSQGAMMAGSLLRTQPDLMAGTVMLSGYLPLEPGFAVDDSRLKGKPVFVAHGTLDPVLPIQFGRGARDYLRSVGADLTYREYTMPHYIGPEELAEVDTWLRAKLYPIIET